MKPDYDTTDPQSEHYMTPGAREAFNAYRRNAIVAFLILAIGVGVGFLVNQDANSDARQEIQKQSDEADEAIVRSGRAVSVAGCNRDYNTIKTLRSQVFTGIQRIKELEKAGTYTHAQAQAGLDSQREFLKVYRLPDCREAEKVVTNNPRSSRPIPEPLYPGSEK